MTERSELRLRSAYFTTASAWLMKRGSQQQKLGLYAGIPHSSDIGDS